MRLGRTDINHLVPFVGADRPGRDIDEDERSELTMEHRAGSRLPREGER